MRTSIAAALCLVLCPVLIAQQNQNPAAAAKPQSTASPAQTSPPPPPHTLLDGTPVKLRLSQTISSADAKVGQEVPFEVVEDVQVDGVTVLPKGAMAIGTVTEAEPKKSMGRAGKLNVSISYARLADQEKVALRAVKDAKGGGHVGAMTGAMVATSIVFFPAAPLFLFMKGKDITIPEGHEVTVYTNTEYKVGSTNTAAATSAVPQPTGTALTNEDVLKLKSAGLGDDLIVAKIT